MKKGIISWFAHNTVTANLVMIVIVAAGVLVLPFLKKEIFPEYAVDIITVQVRYLGAAPEEVEEGVCVRIEEEIQDLNGIKQVRSVAAEGVGTVTVEVIPGYDSRKLLDDVKTRVAAIDTFPEEAEKPVVQELTNRFQVVNVSISGDADERTLKRLGEQVRDEIIALPGITQAELTSARPYEISIEVSEEAMRRHGLSFDDVATAVRRSSLDLPGGSIKTRTGEILLRAKGQAYRGAEFEKLTLLTKPDGTKLRLGDVARIVDGFAETDQSSRLDGEPTVMVQVFRVGEQNALDVAATVREYVADARRRIPEGIDLTIWQDNSEWLRGRMDLLLRNALSGFVLVFVVLALFLRMRLAFWVTIGIPISFLGAIALMPVFELSVNMLSLFSFILVLGIVVDDAIVVGESIYARQQAGVYGVRAAVEGSHRVLVPVVFGVLTTAAAFAPMLFLPGYMGKMWRVIPLIVIPCLMFSLIESKLVLPAHLSHSRPPKRKLGRPSLTLRIWNGFFGLFSDALEWFVQRVYRPSLDIAMEWRYLTVAIALATALLTGGLVTGGYVGFVFFPEVESDFVSAALTMPLETPPEATAGAVRVLEHSALRLRAEARVQEKAEVVRHVLTSVGEQPMRTIAGRNAGAVDFQAAGSHLGEVIMELTPSQHRDMSAGELVRRWREMTPQIPGVVELTYTSDLMAGLGDIDIQFTGPDVKVLRDIANQTKARLAEYPGVFDIADSFRGGKPEVKLAIRSEAEAQGLSLQDLARQVRQGFYGEEVQRIQRGRDDLRVMVRYPDERRRSLSDLEAMRIRTPGGSEAPFSSVASAQAGRGFASIQRVNRERTIDVTANVDEAAASANEIVAGLERDFLPSLVAGRPGVRYSLEGQQREQMESLRELFLGFLGALFAIYVLMAVPFRSYIQPLIVMSAVPFGMVGAVWGHAILGLDLSILSLLGVVALTGIVVNDSLVLVSHINTSLRSGVPVRTAVREAGLVRFRPILLTSLTTAASVTPLILEKSVQAKFLIPMAVGLAAGVLFSTVITLMLIPCGYLMIEDLKRAFRWLAGRSEPVGLLKWRSRTGKELEA